MRTVVLKVVFLAEVNVLHYLQQAAKLSFVDFGCRLVSAKHQLEILFDQIVQGFLKLQGKRSVVRLKIAVRHQQGIYVLKASYNAVD